MTALTPDLCHEPKWEGFFRRRRRAAPSPLGAKGRGEGAQA